LLKCWILSDVDWRFTNGLVIFILVILDTNSQGHSQYDFQFLRGIQKIFPYKFPISKGVLVPLDFSLGSSSLNHSVNQICLQLEERGSRDMPRDAQDNLGPTVIFREGHLI